MGEMVRLLRVENRGPSAVVVRWPGHRQTIQADDHAYYTENELQITIKGAADLRVIPVNGRRRA